jgi:hypothetical protein
LGPPHGYSVFLMNFNAEAGFVTGGIVPDSLS